MAKSRIHTWSFSKSSSKYAANYFYSAWKRGNSQTFKSSSCTKLFFQYACYTCNLLWWMFFIPCSKSEELFFTKVYHYSEIFFNRFVLFFSLEKLKNFEKSPFLRKNPRKSSKTSKCQYHGSKINLRYIILFSYLIFLFWLCVNLTLSFWSFSQFSL